MGTLPLACIANHDMDATSREPTRGGVTLQATCLPDLPYSGLSRFGSSFLGKWPG